MTDAPRSLAVRDYLAIVRANALLVLALALLFGVVAFVYSSRLDKQYRAEAALLFREPRQDVDTLGVATAVRQSPEQRAALGADAVLAPGVTRRVQKQLHRRDLGASIGTRVETRSQLVIIQGVSSDPRQAAKVANAYAKQTLRRERRLFDREVRKLIKQAKRQFRSFGDSREPFIRAEQARLIGRLRALRAVGEPVEIEYRAKAPAAPYAPKPMRNGILGGVLGLTLGLLVAFLRTAADRRLRRGVDVERAAGLPIIGHFTDRVGDMLPGWGRRRDALRLEAARVLRTNVEHLDPDMPLRTILVTSSLPDEGKTTVAHALATAAALVGRRTVLVEGDLRRPTLAKELGLKHRPGLSELLAGDAELADVQQEIKAGRGRTLTAIAAGAAAHHPADLLASGALAPVLAELTGQFDTVVVDSSPVLPVGDTLEIVPHVDAMLLCVRLGKTSEDELGAAREALSRLPSRPSAVVVTGRSERGDGAGGYAARGGYGADAEAARAPAANA